MSDLEKAFGQQYVPVAKIQIKHLCATQFL